MGATEPLIRIRDLHYRYPGTREDVLRIPFLDVRGSGLIAITGPSGVGKSTLVELLAGTLREDYEGSVQVLGQEWKDLKRDADRQRHLRRVGLIPQDFGLLPGWTAEQTLTQDLADSEVPTGQRSERIDRALRQVEIGQFANRRISSLSGGQRQRVAIARMLARDVDLVIADEPTANLDPELVEETVALLKQLASRTPVLVVTHDPRVAEMCDRTIVLQSMVAAPERPAAFGSPLRSRGRALKWIAAAVLLLILGAGTAVALTQLKGHPLARAAQSPVPSLVQTTSVPTIAPTGTASEHVGLPPAVSPAVAIRRTFETYFSSINAGDYQRAWYEYTPAERGRLSFDTFASGDSTTYVPAWSIRSITPVDQQTRVALVTFTSYQDPNKSPNGRDSCDNWILDYTMKLIGSRWLIDGNRPHIGSGYSSC